MKKFFPGLLLLVTLVFADHHLTVQPDLTKEMIMKSVREFSKNIQDIRFLHIPIRDIFESNRKNLKILKNRKLDTLTIVLAYQNKKPVFIIPAQSKGKTLDFSFLVYINPQSDQIMDVDVVEYRETHGMEIDYPVFRKQFRGKNNPSKIVFRRYIKNITGATISARSITLGVRDILFLYLKAKERILSYVQN
jgi:Na+-translocating ferredoxin:NAD+ oxidoreductase RnfG subunit